MRAAVDGVTSLAGANDGGEIDTLPVLIMGNPLPFGPRPCVGGYVSYMILICNMCINLMCVNSAT